jgi:hypothetical protein
VDNITTSRELLIDSVKVYNTYNVIKAPAVFPLSVRIAIKVLMPIIKDLDDG